MNKAKEKCGGPSPFGLGDDGEEQATAVALMRDAHLSRKVRGEDGAPGLCNSKRRFPSGMNVWQQIERRRVCPLFLHSGEAVELGACEQEAAYAVDVA